jgi:hypothetical protein
MEDAPESVLDRSFSLRESSLPIFRRSAATLPSKDGCFTRRSITDRRIFAVISNTNTPMELRFSSAGKNIFGFWHSGPAFANTITATGVTPLQPGVSYHVAYRRRIVGGICTGDVFVNGVKDGSITSALPPDNFDVPTTQLQLGNAFAGGFYIDDARFSFVARTDAEIFDSYRRGALGIGPDVVSIVAARSLPTILGHKLDSNTLALWRLDEVSGAAADSTGVYALTPNGTPTLVPGLIGDGGKAKRFAFPGYYTGAGDAAMGTALLGEWTVEAWFNLDSIPFGIDGRIVDIQDATKRFVWVSVNTAGRLQVFWHAATLQQYDDTTTTLVAGIRYHATARKVSLGGGNYRVDFFLNGVKISSSGSLLNSTAAGAPTIVNLGSGSVALRSQESAMTCASRRWRAPTRRSSSRTSVVHWASPKTRSRRWPVSQTTSRAPLLPWSSNTRTSRRWWASSPPSSAKCRTLRTGSGRRSAS